MAIFTQNVSSADVANTVLNAIVFGDDWLLYQDFVDRKTTSKDGIDYFYSGNKTWRTLAQGDWTTVSGAQSAATGNLVFPAKVGADEDAHIASDFFTGSFFIYMYAAAAYTSGNTVVRFICDLGNTRFWYTYHKQNETSLRKFDGGATTIITDATALGTTEQKIEVSRDSSGNWELLADDVSLGTATDAYMVTNKEKIYINHSGDQDCIIKKLGWQE